MDRLVLEERVRRAVRRCEVSTRSDVGRTHFDIRPEEVAPSRRLGRFGRIGRDISKPFLSMPYVDPFSDIPTYPTYPNQVREK